MGAKPPRAGTRAEKTREGALGAVASNLPKKSNVQKPVSSKMSHPTPGPGVGASAFRRRILVVRQNITPTSIGETLAIRPKTLEQTDNEKIIK
jgi:hypothetical protein